MSVIADVAFGAAPIAGGVLMGALAGTLDTGMTGE